MLAALLVALVCDVAKAAEEEEEDNEPLVDIPAEEDEIDDEDVVCGPLTNVSVVLPITTLVLPYPIL